MATYKPKTLAGTYTTITPDKAKLVVVTWRDIREVSNWDGTDEIRPCRSLWTCGWQLYRGKDPEDPTMRVLVIAKTYDWEEKKWADFTVFPETVVREIEAI